MPSGVGPTAPALLLGRRQVVYPAQQPPQGSAETTGAKWQRGCHRPTFAQIRWICHHLNLTSPVGLRCQPNQLHVARLHWSPSWLLAWSSQFRAPTRSRSKSPPLVGTWQVTSFSVLMLDTSEVLRPLGAHLIGYVQFSPGGHHVSFLSTGTPKQAAGAAYTDAERVVNFQQDFGRVCGHLQC
jgi:hypothetical protein